MARDVQLNGTEISVIKALGIGGSEIDGAALRERCSDLETAEIVDTLKGLISQGYVDADNDSFYDAKGMDKLHFRVNSGYAKDLKEMLDPRPQARKSKRVRRE